MDSTSIISESPSFGASHSSNIIADIADRFIQELRSENGFDGDDIFGDDDNPANIVGEDEVNTDTSTEKVEQNEEDDSNKDEQQFEFAVVCRDSNSSAISDDEIFSDGQICRRYPLFDRSLLLDHIDRDFSTVVDRLETDSKPSPVVRLSLRKLFSEDNDSAASSLSSSDGDNLDGVLPGTYCVWKPNTEQRGKHKKSFSTGNTSNRWKVRDLLKRSYSDDNYSTSKDTSFVVFTPSISTKKKQIHEKEKQVKKITKVASDVGTGAASTKTKNNIPASKAKLAGGNLRRLYIPYRQDQVAMFARFNGSSKNLYRY